MKKINVLNVLIIIFTFLIFDGCGTNVSVPNAKKVDASASGCGCMFNENINYQMLPELFPDGKAYVSDVNPTDEYAPYYEIGVKEDRLWFTSSRKTDGKTRATVPCELFYVTRPASMRNGPITDGWGRPKRFMTGDPVFDERSRGSVTINGNIMIIAAEKPLGSASPSKSTGSSYNLDFWKLERQPGGGWGNPKLMSNNINSIYWDSEPSLSSDGNTLYFTSDRPLPGETQKGDLNVWYSNKDASGQWQTAKPLDVVNTEANETSPFAGDDCNFYFSSDIDGNYDIYKASYSGAEVSENIMKMDNGVNTGSDEQFPMLLPGMKYMLYASNNQAGYGLYDIHCCEVPLPKICLEVKTYEQDMNADGLYMNERKERRGISVILEEIGTGSRKNYSSWDKIDLNLAKNYKISPVFTNPCMQNIKIEPESQIIKTDFAICNDTCLELEFRIVTKQMESQISSVNEAYFLTGYWYPMTGPNYNDYDRKRNTDAGGGEKYFDKSPFIDISFNNKEKVKQIDSKFKLIQSDIEQKINDYYECLAEGDFIMRISFLGYTDPRRLRPGVYPDPTVEACNEKIEKGRQMTDQFGGNLLLSKLRAYFTSETLDEMLSSNSKYLKLKREGRIVMECGGFGPDTIGWTEKIKNYETSMGTSIFDVPDCRRVDIFIDVGPDNLITNRVDDGKLRIKYLPTPENLKRIVVDDRTLPDNLSVSQDTSDCYRMEILFMNETKARLIYTLLKNMYGMELVLEEAEINIAAEAQWMIYSECFENKWDAVYFANLAKKHINNFTSSVRNLWPQAEDKCEYFFISFGVNHILENAKQLQDKLKALGIETDIEKVANGEKTDHRIRYKEKYQYYSIARKKANEFKDKINDPEITRLIKIRSEIIAKDKETGSNE